MVEAQDPHSSFVLPLAHLGLELTRKPPRQEGKLDLQMQDAVNLTRGFTLEWTEVCSSRVPDLMGWGGRGGPSRDALGSGTAKRDCRWQRPYLQSRRATRDGCVRFA